MTAMNYKLENQQIYVHHFGGYVAYSTHTQDFLASPLYGKLVPYKRQQTRKEQTGTYKVKEPVFEYLSYERPDGAISPQKGSSIRDRAGGSNNGLSNS